jgi:RNA polymerase sigma-70 factor (ECF subfamily)
MKKTSIRPEEVSTEIGQKGIFPETRETMINGLRSGDSTRRRQALDILARHYEKPIRLFIKRIGGREDQEQDLFQAFFEFALERDLFSHADPAKGRFRNFICASVKNFVHNEWRRADALKRFAPGGHVPIDTPIETDGIGVQVAGGESPEQGFHRAWMETVITSAAQSLKEEYNEKKMTLHFAVFRDRILKPLLRRAPAASYEALMKDYGIKNAKQVDTCLITARRRFRTKVEDEIWKYAQSEEEAREELNFLFQLVAEG